MVHACVRACVCERFCGCLCECVCILICVLAVDGEPVQLYTMAVISSSAVGFRNLAYNMFFKRTSTTLAFVLGAYDD